MNRLRVFLFASAILLSSCDRFRGTGDPSLQPFDHAVQAMQEQDYVTARRLFEQAAADLSLGSNQEKLAIVRTYLAEVHLALREFRAAATDLVDARSLFTRMGDKRSGIRLSALQGDIEYSMGRYRKAIDSYQAAADAALAFGDKANAGLAVLGVAHSSLAAGNAEAALMHFETALSFAQENGRVEVMAAGSLGKGRALRMLQKYPEALDVLTTVEQGIDDEHAGLRALFHAEIALVRFDLGDATAAVTGLRDAVNALRKTATNRMHLRSDEPVLLAHLARIYEKTGKVADAKAFYEEGTEVARTLGDRLAECYLRAAVLRLPASGAEGKERRSEEWRALARDFAGLASNSGEGYCYVQCGVAAEQRGALDEAQELLARAITIDQKGISDYAHPEHHAPLRAILGMESPYIEWYQSLARVLATRDRPSEALRILEMGNLRELRGAFMDVDISFRQPGVKQLADSVRSLVDRMSLISVELAGRSAHRDLAPQDGEVQSAKQEIESLLQRVRGGSIAVIAAYPNYDVLLPSPVPDIGALQRFIPRGSTLVTFLPTEDRLTIFAVTQKTVTIRQSPIRRDSLMRFVNEYKALLLDPRVYRSDAASANLDAMTRFAGLSARMYELFFRPIEDLIDRTIIVVPDKITQDLPFHAIERQSINGDIKYMIEVAGIDFLPSISSMRYRILSPARTKDVVAFGNPAGKNWSVDYELRDLRSFFPSVHIFVGLETAWNNVKNVSADVVQIATEFTGGTEINPLGDLILSNGLTVEGTMAVRFSKLSETKGIPVVVLSNASGSGSGLGKLHAALLRINGTSDVFFNAWSADRRAAKFFSEYFYTHLANGLAPGDAYRQAMLNLIRSRDLGHQRAWGQFFHFGLN